MIPDVWPRTSTCVLYVYWSISILFSMGAVSVPLGKDNSSQLSVQGTGWLVPDRTGPDIKSLPAHCAELVSSHGTG